MRGKDSAMLHDEDPTVHPDEPAGGGAEREGEESLERYSTSWLSRALVWCAGGATHGETAPVVTKTVLQSVGVAGLFSTMIVALCAAIVAELADVKAVWAAVVGVVVGVLYFSYRRLVVATVASTVFTRSRRTGAHLLGVAVMVLVSLLTAATASWVLGMVVFGQEIRSQVSMDVVSHQQDDLAEWNRIRAANRDVAASIHAEQLAQPDATRKQLQDRISDLESQEDTVLQKMTCEMRPTEYCSETGISGIGPRAVNLNEELSAINAERISSQQRLAEYISSPVPEAFDAVQLATCGYSRQTTELTKYDSDRCQGQLLIESAADQLTPEPPSARSGDGLLPKLEAFGYLSGSSGTAGPVWVVIGSLLFILVGVDLLPLLFLMQSGRRP